jgi:hypothetical protein
MKMWRCGDVKIGGKRGRQSVDTHFHIKTIVAGVLFPPVFLFQEHFNFSWVARGHPKGCKAQQR